MAHVVERADEVRRREADDEVGVLAVELLEDLTGALADRVRGNRVLRQRRSVAAHRPDLTDPGRPARPRRLRAVDPEGGSHLEVGGATRTAHPGDGAREVLAPTRAEPAIASSIVATSRHGATRHRWAGAAERVPRRAAGRARARALRSRRPRGRPGDADARRDRSLARQSRSSATSTLAPDARA